MAWVAVAVAGASLVGAAISSNAATSAADTQAAALRSGQQVTQNEFNTITAQEQPFLQSGYGSMNQLNYLMGTSGGGASQQVPQQPAYTGNYGNNPSNVAPGGYIQTTGQNGPGGPGANTGNRQLQVGPGGATGAPAGATAATGTVPVGTAPAPPPGQSVPGGYGSLNQPFTADMMKQYSPAYQFQLQQGSQGTLNNASMNQGSESGAAMKDLIGYNQNLANTSFNNAFNQYQSQQTNTYNRLLGVSTLGQNAAANLGTQGTQLSANQSQLMASQGAAQAAGQIGSANAISGGIQSASMVPWLMNKTPSAAPAVTSTAASDPMLGTATANMFSDRRLKTHIKPVGMLSSGLPLYRYRYRWENTDRVGVMADEAEQVFPDAVRTHQSGFKVVNYGKIL